MKYLLAVVAFVFLLPYIRIFLKRIQLVIKIKKYRMKIIPTKPYWPFSLNVSKNCDFYIETQDTIYSVKLFSVKGKNNTLCFTKDGYFIRKKFILSAYGSFVVNAVDSKVLKIPQYNFRYCFSKDWYLKDFRKILLINPVCHEIKVCNGNEERVISSGEMVHDMQIYSLSRFVSKIQYENVKKI